MRSVWTFFYGSFINLSVLKAQGLEPSAVEVARLNGYEIRIAPLANLARSSSGCVWGILAQCTHTELGRLYEYARTGLGGEYLPEAVLCETRSGLLRPALCYISDTLEDGSPSREYVDRIVIPAREWGFPAGYLERLESFYA